MPKKKTQRPSKATTPALPVLLGKLALQSVRVVETHSKLNIHGGVIPTAYGSHVETNFGITGEATGLGNVSVTVIGPPPTEDAPKDDGTPKTEWTIVVVVQCVYKIDSLPKNPTPESLGLSKDELRAINSTTTFIAWPYVRAHVQTMTASMGLPPVTLPLLQFGDSGEVKK